LWFVSVMLVMLMRDLEERAMKMMQWLAAVAFVVAGIALLCAPASAQVRMTFVPTRFTVTDGGTVGKPDVVLIPGLASSKSVWDAEAKLLEPNYRLHLVQVDGFAGAPAGANAAGPILAGIVEELHQYIVATKIHPVVIGHSLGGLLTLMLADKYPADMRKMVIVDALPFYGLVFDPNATVASVAPQAKVIHDQMIAVPDDQFAAMQPMMVPSMVKDPAGQKAVAAASIASDRKVFANAMLEDLQTDLRPDMAKIQTPALVLYEYDAESKTTNAGQYEATVKSAYSTMPHVTLVRVEGSRHFIMYDQPVKMDAAIEGFLR
jgi:pimeloyl-ACP methyl ester carboxylesterase